MRVKGMQKTPSSKSEMARLSRNRLVTVRIRVFCRIVRITRTLPVMPNRKMMLYGTNKREKERERKGHQRLFIYLHIISGFITIASGGGELFIEICTYTISKQQTTDASLELK